MNNKPLTEGHKILYFIGYTISIYICFITSAIFQQKIYKVPYPKTSGPSNQSTSDYFTDKITPYGFTSGIACLIGYLMIKDDYVGFTVPLKELAKVSVCDITTHVCLIAALLRTSYTTLIVVNTCSLLSVVLVGAYCSGVKEVLDERVDGDMQAIGGSIINRNSQKIGPQKLRTCLIVCIGIILFTVFNSAQDTAANFSPLQFLITFILFAIAITCQGFRPDFIAQIKQQYRPQSLFLFFSNNGIIFILILILSCLSFQLPYFINFILTHQALLLDLTCYSILCAIGNMFSFKLINIFRQHVYPLVSNTRKCITVCVNIVWYGHHLGVMQWVGVVVVFGGILFQIVSNYQLSDRIMPNENVRCKDGQDYNKIVKQTDDNKVFCQDVEGI